MIHYLKLFLELLTYPGAFRSFLTWKLFSISAYKILNRLKSSDILPASIIDVGANIGQFSVAASHLFPDSRIISIEPDKSIVRKLFHNLPASTSQSIICTAIGSYDGDIVFHFNADSQNSSILPLGIDRLRVFPKNVVLREESVPISKLDTLLDFEALQKPVLLKIDVQGYEDKVLLGATSSLQHIQWVVMETSFARLYSGEAEFLSLIDLMAANGFRFVKPLNFHLAGDFHDIIEMDALFERQF